MPADLKYRRVLLKISGEALMGEREYGQDPSVVARIAAEVKQVHALGVEVCMVIGGGNIFRGLAGAANGIERATADKIGAKVIELEGGSHSVPVSRPFEVAETIIEAVRSVS